MSVTLHPGSLTAVLKLEAGKGSRDLEGRDLTLKVLREVAGSGQRDRGVG